MAKPFADSLFAVAPNRGHVGEDAVKQSLGFFRVGRRKSGRRYPRHAAEAGEMAGDPQVVGLARLSYMYGSIRALEAAALEDLGGEANVPVLKREILAIGLHAESIAMALLNEIVTKMEQSRREGHTPAPSRYKATAVIATFLDLAARRFREVGLDRQTRRVDSYVSEVLERERTDTGSGEAS